jgi:hypothetical protein
LQRAKKEHESQDLLALADSDPASRTPGFEDFLLRAQPDVSSPGHCLR